MTASLRLALQCLVIMNVVLSLFNSERWIRSKIIPTGHADKPPPACKSKEQNGFTRWDSWLYKTTSKAPGCVLQCGTKGCLQWSEVTCELCRINTLCWWFGCGCGGNFWGICIFFFLSSRNIKKSVCFFALYLAEWSGWATRCCLGPGVPLVSWSVVVALGEVFSILVCIQSPPWFESQGIYYRDTLIHVFVLEAGESEEVLIQHVDAGFLWTSPDQMWWRYLGVEILFLWGSGGCDWQQSLWLGSADWWRVFFCLVFAFLLVKKLARVGCAI